jgi:phosphoribosylanthranilate isomerase
MRVRVKICGITRLSHALDACAAGADALGFVFYAGSNRCIDAAEAKSIIEALPPFVTTVGLFVNPEAVDVEEVLAVAGVDLLQFHGDESPDFCAGFDQRYIKALRMADGVDITAEARRFDGARGILLDADSSSGWGGTGETFDWQRWPKKIGKPLVLAGGLDPDNVGTAVTMTRPYAVDVSTGVESAPGIKDPAKIAKFIDEARRADNAV